MPVDYIPHPIRAIPNDMIAARALNVNYQNATLRPLLVDVTTQHTVVAAAICRAIAYLQNVTPPGAARSYVGWLIAPAAGQTYHGYMAFIVPAGWYYRVQAFNAGGNAIALNEWWETNL